MSPSNADKPNENRISDSPDFSNEFYQLLAATLIISLLINGLFAVGSVVVRVSLFDLVLPVAALIAWRKRLFGHPAHYWLFASALLIAGHSVFMVIWGDVYVPELAKGAIKLIYAITAISVLTAVYSRAEWNRASLTWLTLIASVGFLLATFFRTEFAQWRVAASHPLAPTPVAQAAAWFAVHLLINRYIIRSADLRILPLHAAYSVLLAYLIWVNRLDALPIAACISIFLPYVWLLFTKSGANSKIVIGTRKLRIVLLSLIVVAIGIYLFAGNTMRIAFEEPFREFAGIEQRFGETPRRITTRLAMWSLSAREIADHPWLGIGAAQIPMGFEEEMEFRRNSNGWDHGGSIHNSLLSLVLWFGVLGWAFLAGFAILTYLSFKPLGVYLFINLFSTIGPFVLLHDMFGIRGFWIIMSFFLEVTSVPKNKRKEQSIL